MSDRFHPFSMQQLTDWVFDELEAHRSIFGIPESLFFRPHPADPFRQRLYGSELETPFGVAAGPHSQLAQNLIVAWLCGARFMELKTVQTLDELEVSKPCIDMEDEGYNCEWSQELKVHESFDEYLKAWVLIHALHKHLGFPGEAPGVLFNISVGYDLKGIQQPNVVWFLEHMKDATEPLAPYQALVAARVADLPAIPAQLSHNVTLSTMHGCPPDEIGKISRHLMERWGLHTNVKLNPTLLGAETLRPLLRDTLGFTQVTVPDAAFEHDPTYPSAVALVEELSAVAKERGLTFGVKLTNTLEVENHRGVFPEGESMMYMSGRALHAVTVHVAERLAHQFQGELLMSFAGGADAHNVAHLLRSGVRTITTCSDLLRTGGYLRLLQYIDEAKSAMERAQAPTLDALVTHAAEHPDWLPVPYTTTEPTSRAQASLRNLSRYAQFVREDPELHRDTLHRSQSKTPRALGAFDCIAAPCLDECPIDQKVPQYMGLVREGRTTEALAVTRLDNPLAAILGHACDHLCEHTCVRTHMDRPLAIREIKRFILDHEPEPTLHASPPTGPRVAVIGAGPAGVGAASQLARAGYQVEVFEAHPYAGGMVSGTIPAYRTPHSVSEQDITLLKALGAKVHYNQVGGRDFTVESLQERGYSQVIVAAGAQRALRLGLPGEEHPSVHEGLTLLREIKEGRAPALGERVVVIGGGDVAMDCARSAARVTGRPTTVVYRRTRAQMPAQREEVADLLEEGNQLLELASPKALRFEGERLTGLVCTRMALGEPDASGRRRPVAQPGQDFVIEADSVLVAIGQRPDLALFGEAHPVLQGKWVQVDRRTQRTTLPGVYCVGDLAAPGPNNIVSAVADGQRAAAAIRHELEGWRPEPSPDLPMVKDLPSLLKRRATLSPRTPVPHRGLGQRAGFERVVERYTQAQAQAEASRCVDCHTHCSICVGVCPNLAFMTWEARTGSWSLPTYTRQPNGTLVEGPREPHRIRQAAQVAVLTDACNECGNCTTFCPTAGAPYKDKPRLYLHQGDWSAQQDNAYLLQSGDQGWSLQARVAGQTHRLTQGGGRWRYEGLGIEVTLGHDTLEVHSAEAAPGSEGPVSLAVAARMITLLEGLERSMPWLPV